MQFLLKLNVGRPTKTDEILIREVHTKASVASNRRYTRTESETALPGVSTWRSTDNLITIFQLRATEIKDFVSAPFNTKQCRMRRSISYAVILQVSSVTTIFAERERIERMRMSPLGRVIGD